MENINTTAQQEITARLVVNGSNVTMKFAPESNSQILKKAKNILAASFSQSFIQDGRAHHSDRLVNLDKRILMQP